ncbi:MAG: hypothetical protein AAFR29_00780 [Pseudomonadota bacterium]
MPIDPTVPSTTSSEPNVANAPAGPNAVGKKGRRKRRIKAILTGIAPQLAHALGGPLAGAAVERISRALFGSASASEDDIAVALTTATPEQIIALRQADLDFQRLLQETTLEQVRIAAADRANARLHQREMEDWTPSVIGALVIFGFFVVLGAMVARQLPQGAETEFSIMLGALATMTAAVVNYFFGSSAGSKEKTKLMSLMGPKDPDDPQSS